MLEVAITRCMLDWNYKKLWFLDIDLGSNNANLSSIQTNDFTKPSDFGKPTTGWINTVPLSNSTATLSRKSAKSRRVPMADNFVKCYLKKRNLILDLLVSKHCFIFEIMKTCITHTVKLCWQNTILNFMYGIIVYIRKVLW